MKKWFLLVIIILALGLAAVYRIYAHMHTKQAESIDVIQKREGLPVRVAEALREDLKETVVVSGSLNPLRRIKIASLLMNERIQEIHVCTGEKVTAGQRLVTLDDRTSQLNVATAEATCEEAKVILQRLKNGSRPEEIEAARAQMEQAKATFDLLEIEWERQKKLYKEEATTLQMLQDIESKYYAARAAHAAARAHYQLAVEGSRQEDIGAAEARVKLAEAALGQAQKNLEDHYLSAPFAGIVTLKSLDPGDIAEANTPIFHLVDTDQVYLDVDVSELYIPKLHAGLEVRVTVDALPDLPLTGAVAEINPIANQHDRSFSCRIRIDNREGRLKPGMFARAHIVVKEARNVIVIPDDAVRTEGEKQHVLIVVSEENDQVTRKAPITTGRPFGRRIEVLEGLSGGEQVITLGMQIEPGIKVTIAP